MYVRETLARVFYLTSKKMLAKDDQSSFQKYLQATFCYSTNSCTLTVGLPEQAKVISRWPNKQQGLSLKPLFKLRALSLKNFKFLRCKTAPSGYSILHFNPSINPITFSEYCLVYCLIS